LEEKLKLEKERAEALAAKNALNKKTKMPNKREQ